MIDLSVKYMNMKLRNPIIVGACSLTSNLSKIKEIEKEGAGAIVIKSLFEEQIQLEKFQLEDELEKYDNRHPEMLSVFPKITHAGPREHLHWLKKTLNEVSIPVIASLNAVEKDTWLEYANLLEATNVDAIELNLFHSPKDIHKDGKEIEEEQIELLKRLRDKITVPLAVKLSSFYSNPSNFICKIDQIGIDSVVVFNRFFQPDIDVEMETNILPFNLSKEKDYRLPLRYIGLLADEMHNDLCGNTGIFSAEDVIRMLLAGASTVQIVSTLYKNGITQISKILSNLEKWMQKKGYKSLDDFRGKLSKKSQTDPWAYSRSQYVRLLLSPEKILDKQFPV